MTKPFSLRSTCSVSVAVAHLVLVEELMRRTLAILLLSASGAFGQPTVISNDRLPPDSIELEAQRLASHIHAVAVTKARRSALTTPLKKSR